MRGERSAGGTREREAGGDKRVGMTKRAGAANRVSTPQVDVGHYSAFLPRDIIFATFDEESKFAEPMGEIARTRSLPSCPLRAGIPRT